MDKSHNRLPGHYTSRVAGQETVPPASSRTWARTRTESPPPRLRQIVQNRVPKSVKIMASLIVSGSDGSNKEVTELVIWNEVGTPRTSVAPGHLLPFEVHRTTADHLRVVGGFKV